MVTNSRVIHQLGVMPWSNNTLVNFNYRMARQAQRSGDTREEVETAYFLAASTRLMALRTQYKVV